ncbi:redoxin domain-containing protein [Rhodobacteraceae bacterium CYK-10]|uniref:Glutathione peroxidase n=2 Tax=Stagnihabitans tardus TaxID=2699202 RepID=A0AAE4Y9E5_9RHOB|nr:redoxin domain-containing protein [Stagnihabitans tardus]
MFAQPLSGPAPRWSLPSIEGGVISSSDFKGKALLLVNSASLCGYTPQYTGLQALQDKWGDRGLVVLAVPSDDFNQEKDSNGAVKEFCELTFGLSLPMAEISHVTGPEAAGPYPWLAQELGFVPRWNFNKVLFDGEGRVIGTWGSGAEPLGGEIEAAVSAALS